jgi:LEA14-like dessication related protein
MKRTILLFGTLFLLFSSCIELQEVNVVSFGKVKLETIDGNMAKVNVDVELANANFFGIKIRPSVLDVYVEEEYIGKVYLLEKVKIKKKSTQVYNAKIQLEGEEGILRKVIKYSLKKELKIRLSGNVKGSVYGIPKKVKVNETKTIDGRKLMTQIPFLN